MYRVRLVNENVTVSVTGGTLAQACAAAGYPIEQVCGGRGACGKCRVEISRGSVRETVLACRETVLGDVEVYLTPEQASRQVAIVTEGEAAWNRVLCPQVSKRCRTRRELVPEHGRACLPGGEPAVLRRFARLMGGAGPGPHDLCVRRRPALGSGAGGYRWAAIRSGGGYWNHDAGFVCL